MSFEGTPTNATSDSSNESKDPWVPLGPLEQSKSEPNQEKPQFDSFDTLSEHYGGIDEGSIIVSGGEKLKVVGLVENPEKEGDGELTLMRNKGKEQLKNASFSFMVDHQDLIEDVIHPKEETLVENYKEREGQNEEKEPVVKPAKKVDAKISDEEWVEAQKEAKDGLKSKTIEKVETSPPPDLNPHLEDRKKSREEWGDNYMKEYVDNEKKPSPKDETGEYTAKSKDIINNIKNKGFEINLKVKERLAQEIKADNSITDKDRLQRYLGMMEQDLDYARYTEPNKGIFARLNSALLQVDMKANIMGLHDKRENLGAFKGMVNDMKFAASLLSRRSWKEVIEARTQVIEVINNTAEKTRNPLQRSFYTELAKEYEELNNRDKEWINKKIVLGSIGSGVSKLAEKMFGKEDSEDKKEPVKQQREHVMRDPDKDSRNSYAQDTLSQAEEDFEQNRGKVKLPEKKKRWQWIWAWWKRK